MIRSCEIHIGCKFKFGLLTKRKTLEKFQYVSLSPGKNTWLRIRMETTKQGLAGLVHVCGFWLSWGKYTESNLCTLTMKSML